MNFRNSLKLTLFYYLITFSINAKEGMPQFNVKSFPSQIFWLVLTFSILYIVVSWIILPRIRENIRLRKNKVSNNIERAEVIKNDIEKMIEEYNSKIIEARNNVSNMIKKSIIKSTVEFNNQIEIIKKQLESEHKNVEKRLNKHKTELERDITEATVSTAVQIIKKIINKNITSEDLKPLLKEVKYNNKV